MSWTWPRRVLISVAVLWASLTAVAVPASVWRGLAVVEPWDVAIRERTDGREHGAKTEFSWLPPTWRCIGSDGTEARIPAVGRLLGFGAPSPH